MSYSIQLALKDGTVTVTGQSGQIPDGTLTVNGHEDSQSRNISANLAARGNMVVSASGFARRAD